MHLSGVASRASQSPADALPGSQVSKAADGAAPFRLWMLDRSSIPGRTPDTPGSSAHATTAAAPAGIHAGSSREGFGGKAPTVEAALSQQGGPKTPHTANAAASPAGRPSKADTQTTAKPQQYLRSESPAEVPEPSSASSSATREAVSPADIEFAAEPVFTGTVSARSAGKTPGQSRIAAPAAGKKTTASRTPDTTPHSSQPVAGNAAPTAPAPPLASVAAPTILPPPSALSPDCAQALPPVTATAHRIQGVPRFSPAPARSADDGSNSAEIQPATAQHAARAAALPDAAGRQTSPRTHGGTEGLRSPSFPGLHPANADSGSAVSAPVASLPVPGAAGQRAIGALPGEQLRPSAHAAFERMDSAPPPQVLASGPQRLEVGIRDAGLGWVEVRTHAAAGHIAAVVAASPEAHTALAAQLPAMREYLASQHVRIATLASEPFSSSAHSGQSSSGQAQTQPESRGGSEQLSLAGTAVEADEENLSYFSVRA